MPLNPLQLQIRGDDDDDDDEEDDGTAAEEESDEDPIDAFEKSRSVHSLSEGPPALKAQDSFELSETLTLSAPDVKLRGSRGMETADGSEASSLHLADLSRGRRLGSGSSSKVFLCTHRQTGRQFAVKELSAMADRGTRHMAMNELRIAQRARSEHIIEFFDAFFDEGKIAIVLEFADRGSLEELIARTSGVPEPMLACLASQLLRGVEYLHTELRQVHRDLKPANVVLTSAGQAKISDFGISRQLETSHAFAMTQVGTMAYMSPERMMGEAYSYASDVWSFGLMVLEALLGQSPYPPASSFMGMVSLVVHGPPPEPPASSSAALGDFLSACLDKQPAQRAGAPQLLEMAWLDKPPPPPELAAWMEELVVPSHMLPLAA